MADFEETVGAKKSCGKRYWVQWLIVELQYNASRGKGHPSQSTGVTVHSVIANGLRDLLVLLSIPGPCIQVYATRTIVQQFAVLIMEYIFNYVY